MHPIEASLQARLQAFKDFKVKHPRLEEIDHTLRQAIHGHRSYTLLPLYGASGVGKSTVLQRVADRCREEEANPSVVPVVVVQVSPEDIGASARLDYYRQILAKLRGNVAVNDRVRNLALAANPGKKSSNPSEWLDMREAVVYALELLHVKAVFVDEAPHLMYVDAPHKPTTQLDWLKTLTNRTNVLHVLVGYFELYDFCHLNSQVARRMRDLPFPRYHLDNQTECEEFVGALRSLLEQVPLAVDVPGLLTHWRWFGDWSLGCIGVLSDWIVETVDALYKRGETTLALEALKKHALQPDQRVRMEMEVRTGEYKVERVKAQSEQELQQLLVNSAPIPGTVHTSHSANGASSLDVLPDTPRNTHSQTRIERTANRDPVGDQILTGKTLKCSFSGVLSIEPKHFLDSGVEAVECPNCVVMRSLELRKGILRFPSHDKRKTRTTPTGQRWAMRESTWEVVGG